jgi:hypothetical protein
MVSSKVLLDVTVVLLVCLLVECLGQAQPPAPGQKTNFREQVNVKDQKSVGFFFFRP